MKMVESSTNTEPVAETEPAPRTPLIDHLGRPVRIAGGSPEADEETVDQSDRTDEAPETGSAEIGEESFTDSYNPNAIEDEAARKQLETAYKQLQGDYTRKTQETSQRVQEAEAAMGFVNALRSDQTRAQALREIEEAFGVRIADGAEEEGDLTPDDELRREIEELRQWRDEQENVARSAMEEQEELAFLGEQIESLEKQMGREVSDEEAEVLASIGLGSPDQTGKPDLRRANQLLDAVVEARIKARAEAKRAPRPLGAGRSASKAIDLSDRDSRLDAAARAAEAAMS